MLIAPDVNRVLMQECPLEKPARAQVLVKSQFGSSKLGTELAAITGTASTHTLVYDQNSRMMLPRKGKRFPCYPGNMTVGEIVETGSDVQDFAPGERVFFHGHFREYHTVETHRLWRLTEALTPEMAVCMDPAEVALGAVRDGHIRLGDAVVVFGLGAIGLFAIQLARLQGAATVIGVDPMRNRRSVACDLGADVVLNPSACDVGVAVRKILGRPGADVCIETSANYHALHDAVRAAGYGATVAVVSFYRGEAVGLRLGEEWHFNRLNMVSSRTTSLPVRDHPRWDRKRLYGTVLKLLSEAKLQTDRILDPIVSFQDAADAYLQLLQDPSSGIKLAVYYPGGLHAGCSDEEGAVMEKTPA